MRLISACPLCLGTDLRDLYTARDPHYGIPGEYRIVRCKGCALRFVNPMCSDEELALLYPFDYYAYNDPPKVIPWKVKAKKLLGYWQGSKGPKFEKPGTFLDIGCGSGEVVERMQQLDWDSYGIELDIAPRAMGGAAGCRSAAEPFRTRIWKRSSSTMSVLVTRSSI